MELTAYIRLARRWLWLIILAAAVAGSISFANSRTQQPRYRASTTIQIGTYLNLTDPNPGMIQSAAALAQTYIALLRTSSVLNVVADSLQLPFSAGALAGMFSGELQEGTSLLVLSVTYTDPVIAADIANELARQLVLNSPTELTQGEQEQITILEEEIRAARAQLQHARDEAQVIDETLDTVGPEDQSILVVRRSELVAEINSAQNNLALMTQTIAQLQQRGTINYLKVIEPAGIPTGSINASPVTATLTAAFTGAAIALGIAFLLEYLNDSIRTPAEVMPLLNVPLFGAIAPFGNKRSYRNKLITWVNPRSTIAEAYRALRVNLLFRETSDNGSAPETRVYAITSSGPGEGKSVTAANLAVTFAITGMRVLLIDADLRRPALHLIFDVPNSSGLSSIFGKEESLRTRTAVAVGAGHNSDIDNERSLMTRNIQLYLSHIVQKTEVTGLDIITAGPTPPNPAELLDTPQMRELLAQVSQKSEYDVVLIDTPPTLVVTDASIITSVAKAKVILVIEAGRTHRGAAVRAVQQLRTLGVEVLGVVMNRLRPSDRDSEYGYYYYYYGYTSYGNRGGTPPQQINPGPGPNSQAN